MIAIYVDDGPVCCNNKNVIRDVIKHLQTKFEITVMDPECFVGILIKRDRAKQTLKISQEYYIIRIIKKFNLESAKTAQQIAIRN